MPIAAAISAAGGLLSSLLSHNAANKQLNAQREENSLNRQFNADQAELNRKFQVEMFNRENAYNDPKAVMSRLQSAGVNPALAYGGFADSASAMSGSTASYSGGVNPSLADYSGIQSAGNAMLQAQMVAAQTRLADAQARNINQQSDFFLSMQDIYKETAKYGLDLAKLLPESELKRQDLTDAQKQHYLNSAENIQRNWPLVDEAIKSKKLENANLEITLKYADENQRETINNMIASTQKMFAEVHLTDQEAFRIALLAPYEARNISANTALTNQKTQTEEWNTKKTRAEYKEQAINTTIWQRTWQKNAAKLINLRGEREELFNKGLERAAYGNQLDWFNAVLGGAATVAKVAVH